MTKKTTGKTAYISYSEKLPKWLKISGIYKLVINDKIYIGSAIDLSKRLRSHLNGLKANKHGNIHLQRAFNKYKQIDFEIIETVMFAEHLIQREQFYIDTIKPQYNIAPKAGSRLGLKHSEETKKLISKVQMGRKMSDEAKYNCSKSKKGLKFSDTHRKNIALAKMGNKNPFYKAGDKHPQYGIAKSAITRERISITSKLRGINKGKNNSASKSGVLYDAVTGNNYIFHSLKPLCELIGINYKGICSSIHRGDFYLSRYLVDYIVTIPKNCETKIIKT